jgi:hypothetical protein
VQRRLATALAAGDSVEVGDTSGVCPRWRRLATSSARGVPELSDDESSLTSDPAGEEHELATAPAGEVHASTDDELSLQTEDALSLSSVEETMSGVIQNTNHVPSDP